MATTTNHSVYDHDTTDTIVDMSLFKKMGLYQLLWPTSGRTSRIVMLTVLWLALTIQFVQTCRLYWALDDVQQFLFLVSVLLTGLMCIFKGFMVVYKADAMWPVLEVAKFGFTACGRRYPDELRRCRRVVSVWLHVFIMVSYGTLVFWIFPPLFARSSSTYSWPIWTIVYLMESFILTVNVFSWLLFDCYFVTVTFALYAQSVTMATSYENIGRRSSDTRVDSPKSVSHYDELIAGVRDNQSIMKKFDDFFDIVRPVVLIQVAQVGNVAIMLVLLAAFVYLGGSSMISALIIKYLTAFISLTFQLYIYCYALHRLETAKTMINFGLYGSNWTEMDLKFKKTLLLIMSMNSAHRRMMKVSPKSVVNMEMFARVMNISYSTVSVILKMKGDGAI